MLSVLILQRVHITKDYYASNAGTCKNIKAQEFCQPFQDLQQLLFFDVLHELHTIVCRRCVLIPSCICVLVIYRMNQQKLKMH